MEITEDVEQKNENEIENENNDKGKIKKNKDKNDQNDNENDNENEDYFSNFNDEVYLFRFKKLTNHFTSFFHIDFCFISWNLFINLFDNLLLKSISNCLKHLFFLF